LAEHLPLIVGHLLGIGSGRQLQGVDRNSRPLCPAQSLLTYPAVGPPIDPIGNQQNRARTGLVAEPVEGLGDRPVEIGSLPRSQAVDQLEQLATIPGRGKIALDRFIEWNEQHFDGRRQRFKKRAQRPTQLGHLLVGRQARLHDHGENGGGSGCLKWTNWSGEMARMGRFDSLLRPNGSRIEKQDRSAERRDERPPPLDSLSSLPRRMQ
jgi:hypothetical protein